MTEEKKGIELRPRNPRTTNLTIDEMVRVAGAFAASGMFPDVRSAQGAFVQVMAGQEMGIGPFDAITNIHVIKGKPVASANLEARMLKQSGKYDYTVQWIEDGREVVGCTVTVVSIETGVVLGDSTFDQEDARRAGLAGGENYRKYPRNMFFARAISNAVAWYCPEVVGTRLYSPGEMGATDGEVYEEPDHGLSARDEPGVVVVDDAEVEVVDPLAPEGPIEMNAEPESENVPTITAGQIRMLHAIARDAGLTDDQRHELNLSLTGQRHTDRIPMSMMDEVLATYRSLLQKEGSDE